MRSPAGLLMALMATLPAAAAGQPLSDADLEFLIAEAESWVWELRDEHRPHARPLTAGERLALGSFFPAEVIDRARVRRVAGIPNPGFYSFFRQRGEPDPIDFGRMSALSVIDTVLVVESRVDPHGPGWLALLFHELVHNTQRFVLGEREMEAYVRGWAASGSYGGIPAEVQAYELAARFRSDPGRVFDVERVVRGAAWGLHPQDRTD